MLRLSPWFHFLRLYIFCVLCCFGTLSAATVQGVLYDASNNSPLDGVQIVIKPSQQTATSGRDGFFRMSLPAGSYTLTFHRTGYALMEEKIHIEGEQEQRLLFALQPTLLKLHEDVTVTAERDMLATFHSPAAITSVALREFDLPRSTPEALMGSQGVWMQKTNHGGGSPFIRGLTGNQVLVLIDGIRLNNTIFRYGPNQYLNTVDPYSISRMEVLRGFGATLYGSDAMGGVLNLLTPMPKFSSERKQSVQAITKYQSADMEKTAHVNVGLSTARLALSVGASLRSFGDVRAGSGVGVQSPSGYDESAGQFKAALHLNDRLLLTMLWHKMHQEDVPAYDQVHQRGYARYLFTPQDRQLAYLRSTLLSNHPLFRRIEITASYHESLEGRERQKNNSTVAIWEKDRVHTFGLQVQAHAGWGGAHQLIYGLEAYRDVVHSSSEQLESLSQQRTPLRGLYPDGASSYNSALYLSYIRNWSSMSLHSGLRYNLVHIEIQDAAFGDTDLSPSALAGHCSMLYRFSDRIHGVVNASSSFRAPNVNDLSTFGPFDYGIEVPAPLLKPEYGYTLEGGVKTRSDHSSLALFLYHTWMRDMITRVEGSYLGSSIYQGDRVYQKANLQKAVLRGIEAEGEWQPAGRWLVRGNVNYCYGQNLSDDEPMRRIPPLNGRVALVHHLNRQWSWTIESQAAATQTRLSSGDLSDHRIPVGGTPGWHVVNGAASWRPGAFTVTAGIANLFDEAYRTHGSGIFMYGRCFWLGLQVGR
ncbi:MAG TPA: TonB-dependent receptor [bacterium]|nr:TonB-dependent receptor [bacterium]